MLIINNLYLKKNILVSMKAEQKVPPGRETNSADNVTRAVCRNLTAAAASLAARIEECGSSYSGTRKAFLLSLAARMRETSSVGSGYDLRDFVSGPRTF